MANVDLLTDVVSGERYFRALSTGMLFRRTVGALVWPCGDRNGCLLVLGEARTAQNVLGGRHAVHKLEEVRGQDVNTLTAALARLNEDWLVRFWATSTADRRTYLLDDLADEQRRLRRPVARYGDPQGWKGTGEGLLPFYHALVQRRTMGEKSLFFGECAGADQVGKMSDEDMTKKPTDFPAAAALFFALAEIDLNQLPEWGEHHMRPGSGPADLVGGY